MSKDYRTIGISFWNDGFVLDLTPDEKCFYLYLITNAHRDTCGCYELPIRTIAHETGFDRNMVQTLLERFIRHGKIMYDPDTREILLLNWKKHNAGFFHPKSNTCKHIKQSQQSIKSPVLAQVVDGWLREEDQGGDETGDMKPLASPLQAPCEETGRGLQAPEPKPEPKPELEPKKPPLPPLTPPSPQPGAVEPVATTPDDDDQKPFSQPNPEPDPCPMQDRMTLKRFVACYHATFGVLMSAMLNEEARLLVSRFPRDSLEAAFLVTAEKGGRSLSYLKAVLENKPQKKGSEIDWGAVEAAIAKAEGG